MVILGLGSSQGDRLAHLRRALDEIKKIKHLSVVQVSGVYLSDAMLPDNAADDWNVPYLNIAVRCDTTATPHELLQSLKAIEKNIGRKQSERWAPRIIDIDILAWDDLVVHEGNLLIPHKGLLDRPFALWPLADVAPYWIFPGQQKTAAELVKPWGSRFTGEAPFHTRQIYHRVDTPRIMGIVNVTPDSYSDGGMFQHVDAAIKQALHLVETGAEIIDIGAEATSPRSTPITPEEEWKRLQPVLAAIQQAKNQFLLPPKISIDSRRATVMEKALAYDIDWLNDVTGFRDAAMVQLAVDSGKDCLVMHHVTIPAHDKFIPSHANAVDYIHEWASKHLDDLERQGIAREKIIFDPGIGFGKDAHQSVHLIRDVARFTKLGTRILIGHSRKSFMSLFTHLPFSERDTETLACGLYMAEQPVDYLRVHNVEMLARGLRMWRALT